jgi:class 3 adenylate cyclase
MILSGIVLAVTLSMTSLKIIRGGKGFTQVILEENKTFVVNTLRFGHGVMSHAGTENYGSLIDLALKRKFVRYLSILDKEGKMIAQSDPPGELTSFKKHDLSHLKDGKILEETKGLLLVSYQVEEIVADKEHTQHHNSFMGHTRVPPKPSWFLVGLDTSAFKRHYNDMVVQTVGTGAAFLLLGFLVIIFLGVIQRYELAHLAIEKLHKIKRLLGHFVPNTAKNVIEMDPEKKGLLDKYVQDTTILFLDIEGFSLLVQKHSPEQINRTIETYFSTFLDLIQKNRGDINETAGDGMMVIFQDPDPVQHAKNATQSALQIQEQCLKLPENGDPDLFSIRVNIGIQSGETYLGSTKMRGSEGERWTFTATGAVTITAARLAEHARAGQILIGEETASRVREFFSLNPLGKVPLKNIKDSGEIYEISTPKS